MSRSGGGILQRHRVFPAELAGRRADHTFERAAERSFGVITELFRRHCHTHSLAQPQACLMHAYAHDIAGGAFTDDTCETFSKAGTGCAHQRRKFLDVPVFFGVEVDGRQHPSEFRIAHGSKPAARIAAAMFHPCADQRCRQHVGKPCQNAARTDAVQLHLARHGFQQVWNGWIALGEVAGQHHIWHHLEQGMQIVHVETHRGGKGNRIPAGTGTLQVEDTLTDFLLAEVIKRRRCHGLAAAKNMRVASGKKHRVAACERQPLAGRFAQLRLANTDKMKPCGFLLGKGRRPWGSHAAPAIFHPVKPQATQHFGEGIIHACFQMWTQS
ncbi:Hypothetical protein AT6N2_L0218 [Agrobacterium tumefaciens]|nr:Hypothetical protein AT6N2_L0218 [Agrobacterium tumefaciens]